MVDLQLARRLNGRWMKMGTPQSRVTVPDPSRRTHKGDNMKRRELLSLYSHLGLIVAASALVVGIVGAPLLPWIWSPTTVVAQR
jgi:hypothetical protein